MNYLINLYLNQFLEGNLRSMMCAVEKTCIVFIKIYTFKRLYGMNACNNEVWFYKVGIVPATYFILLRNLHEYDLRFYCNTVFTYSIK